MTTSLSCGTYEATARELRSVIVSQVGLGPLRFVGVGSSSNFASSSDACALSSSELTYSYQQFNQYTAMYKHTSDSSEFSAALRTALPDLVRTVTFFCFGFCALRVLRELGAA